MKKINWKSQIILEPFKISLQPFVETKITLVRWIWVFATTNKNVLNRTVYSANREILNQVMGLLYQQDLQEVCNNLYVHFSPSSFVKVLTSWVNNNIWGIVWPEWKFIFGWKPFWRKAAATSNRREVRKSSYKLFSWQADAF